MLVCPDSSTLRISCNPLNIAMAQRPDLRQGILIIKKRVSRRRITGIRQPQNFSQVAVHLLSLFSYPVSIKPNVVAAISQREQKCAVRQPLDTRPKVLVTALII